MKSISLLAVCALLSVFPARAQMQMAGLLKPRDEVIIEMQTPPGDAPKPPATYVISDQGKLKLPMLKQEIPAAGVSLKTLTSNINEAYQSSGIHPVPSVKKLSFPPIEGCSHVVTIRGGVHKPGEYPLRQGMTLMAVIDRAGGLPYKVKKVKLLRDKKEWIYDLGKINADDSNNPVLMDGDQIIVPLLSAPDAAPGLLGPGDTVLIALNEPAADSHRITAIYTVSDQGTIRLPLLKQEIPASGISVSALARSIEIAYKKEGIFETPVIRATLPIGGKMSAKIVVVGGQVNGSGEFPLRQGTTLMEAIKKAGGFTEAARISRVKLLRADKLAIYDLRKIKPDGSNNPALMDGDQIIVPAFSAPPGLRLGDTVWIQLREPEERTHEISSIYTLSARGTLKLPMLKQEIPASEISTSTLARQIEIAYKKEGIFKTPVISVARADIDSPDNIVTIGGEVRNSNEYPWVEGMTLMEAIQKAGGFNEFAAISRVKVIRADKELIYDLRKIKPDSSNNPILMDQDQIIVPMD